MWERVLVKRFTTLTQKQLIACHPVATALTNSNSKYANVYARIFVHFELLTTLKMADPTDIQQDRVGHAEVATSTQRQILGGFQCYRLV